MTFRNPGSPPSDGLHSGHPVGVRGVAWALLLAACGATGKPPADPPVPADEKRREPCALSTDTTPRGPVVVLARPLEIIPLGRETRLRLDRGSRDGVAAGWRMIVAPGTAPEGEVLRAQEGESEARWPDGPPPPEDAAAACVLLVPPG
jgi:hypothetical protein